MLYLEVYNQDINDLITKPPHLNLKIRGYFQYWNGGDGVGRNICVNPGRNFQIAGYWNRKSNGFLNESKSEKQSIAYSFYH